MLFSNCCAAGLGELLRDRSRDVSPTVQQTVLHCLYGVIFGLKSTFAFFSWKKHIIFSLALTGRWVDSFEFPLRPFCFGAGLCSGDDSFVPVFRLLDQTSYIVFFAAFEVEYLNNRLSNLLPLKDARHQKSCPCFLSGLRWFRCCVPPCCRSPKHRQAVQHPLLQCLVLRFGGLISGLGAWIATNKTCINSCAPSF